MQSAPAPTARPWTLRPGDKIVRKELHQLYGGRRQGGIGPSNESPNVFIFTDPKVGVKYGYIDDWFPDGDFHYTGEGQRNDQQMNSGNLTILRHKEQGRALRVFEGVGGPVRYVDEFEIEEVRPWYQEDATEVGTSTIRKVIVFRLRPRTIAPRPPSNPYSGARIAETVSDVPVEESNTERAFVDPNRQPYWAERREAALVQSLRAFLVANGHEVTRKRILPAGEGRPLFSDLYDVTLNLLIEAKGTVTREAFRMAIGQLADYARFIDRPRKAILLPESPREDLHALAAAERIELIWPAGSGFAGTARLSGT